jgi:2-dehydro-3-deoxygluconokinase
MADIFLPGINEAKTILGISEPEKIAEHYLSRGTKTVIIKLGADGAYYANEKESGYVPGFDVDTIVDTVGAGDGFAVGVLTALREDLPLAEAVRRGCAIGSIQLLSKGDNDGLPTTEELKKFMDGDPNWR